MQFSEIGVKFEIFMKEVNTKSSLKSAEAVEQKLLHQKITPVGGLLR